MGEGVSLYLLTFCVGAEEITYNLLGWFTLQDFTACYLPDSTKAGSGKKSMKIVCTEVKRYTLSVMHQKIEIPLSSHSCSSDKL